MKWSIIDTTNVDYDYIIPTNNLEGPLTLREVGFGEDDAATGEERPVKGKDQVQVDRAMNARHVSGTEAQLLETDGHFGAHFFQPLEAASFARLIFNLKRKRWKARQSPIKSVTG